MYKYDERDEYDRNFISVGWIKYIWILIVLLLISFCKFGKFILVFFVFKGWFVSVVILVFL